MSKLIKWIDLRDNIDKGRLKVSTITDEEGRSRQILFIVGMDSKSARWERAINTLGFNASARSKYLVRAVQPGERIQAATFKPVWPNAAISMMPAEDVILDLKSTATLRATQRERTPEESNVAIESGVVVRLGRNADGLEVYSSPMGRFIQQENGQKTQETNLLRPEMFLRSGHAIDSMDLCADGFVKAMAIGEVQHSEDLDRFIGAVLDREGPFSEDVYDQVATAVDAALVRFIGQSYETANDAYGDVSRLYQYLPPYKGKKRGSAAMPLPVSVIAQRLLGDTKGKSVFLPNAWDGASFALLPSETKIFAFRGDKDMSRYALEAREDEVTWGNRFDSALHRDADALLFNADPVVDDAGNRTDYRDALTSLRSLKNGGRAVFVLAGDNPQQPGLISNETKRFLDALGRRYDIEIAFEVGSELSGKVGTNHSLRVISLRNRPATQNSKRFNEFDVLHSWDSIKTLVDEAIVTIDLQEAEAESIDIDRAASDNEFQRPYLAFSKIGEARTMVPKNLQEPLQYALANLEKYNGPLDAFVEKELEFGKNTLGDRFSPEQCDAIGLAVARIKTGRGIIIGDETGIGKGRILSGMATWAQKKGRDVIFVTDRANLFSDLLRDLRDIQEWGRFQPFIMNADGVLMDVFTNEVIQEGTPGKRMQAIIDAKSTLSDINCNLIFTTYSQVSGEGSAKADWLLAQAEKSLVIVDEAHIAAGSNSNTSQVIVDLVNRAWGVIYSSATWAKSSENLHVYGRAFPEGINVATLTQTMRTGGEPFSEVFSSMLARDGAFIRREHDLSKIEFRVEVDTNRQQRNSDLSDRVAAILASMTYVAGDLNKIIIRLNNETMSQLRAARNVRQQSSAVDGQYRPREGRLFRSNFGTGSVLYQVMRRFLAVLNADQVADLALKAIDENRKPVIVFDDTGEVFLKRIINAERIPGIEGERDVLPTEVRPPTIRDMLYGVMKRLGVLSVSTATEDDVATQAQLQRERDALISDADQDGVDLEEIIAEQDSRVTGPRRGVTVMDLPGISPQQQEEYAEGVKSILKLIDELPPIPLNAIDLVRMRLEATGLRVGEVSGRSMRLSAPLHLASEPIESPEFANHLWRIEARDKRKRSVTSTVFAFNSGELDVVFLNRSAATGISLHASPRFSDTRRRELIEMQIPPNPTDRIQLYGRVNRFDQVVTPRISIATTGIYGEVRELMQQNKKLARLSANIRSSRDNAAEIKSIPDLLNSIGEEIARRYLDDNGGIRSRLGITLEEMERSGFSAVQRLTSRVPLLLVTQQKMVYEELYELFYDTLAAYEMAGENPLKPREMDVRAEVVEKRIAIGTELEGVSSAFDGPVYLKKLQWEEDRKPIDANGMRQMVKSSRMSMVKEEIASFAEIESNESGDGQEDSIDLPKIDFSAMTQKMSRILEAKIRIELAGSEFEDVSSALISSKDNSVKRAYARSLWVNKYFDLLVPGCIIGVKPKTIFKGNFNLSPPARFGVVVKIHHPGRGKEANLSRWKFDVLMPDSEKPETHTLSTLMEGVSMFTTRPMDAPEAAPSIELATNHLIVGDIFNPNTNTARFRAEPLLTQFDAELRYGKRKRTALVLDGNMYLASEWAASTGEGTGVIYTDSSGLRHRAVLMNSMLNQAELMRYLPVRLWSPKMISAFLKRLLAPLEGEEPVPSNYVDSSFLLSTSFKDAMRSARGLPSKGDEARMLLLPGKGVALLVPKADVSRMLRGLRSYMKRFDAQEHPGVHEYSDDQLERMNFSRITISSRSAEKRTRRNRDAEGDSRENSPKANTLIFINSEDSSRFDMIVEIVSRVTGIELYIPRSEAMGDLAERVQREHFIQRREEFEEVMRANSLPTEQPEAAEDIAFRERQAT